MFKYGWCYIYKDASDLYKFQFIRYKHHTPVNGKRFTKQVSRYDENRRTHIVYGNSLKCSMIYCDSRFLCSNSFEFHLNIMCIQFRNDTMEKMV